MTDVSTLSGVERSLIFTGLRIIEDRYCGVTITKQVRFPRSKKKRIRQKWAKQQRNFRTWFEPRAYRIGDSIIAHPVIVDRIRRGVSALSDKGV